MAAQRAQQIAAHLNYPKGMLNGQVAIVTGSGQGIGAEAARLFARLHPKKLIIACRNEAKGEAAITCAFIYLSQMHQNTHVHVAIEKDTGCRAEDDQQVHAQAPLMRGLACVRRKGTSHIGFRPDTCLDFRFSLQGAF